MMRTLFPALLLLAAGLPCSVSAGDVKPSRLVVAEVKGLSGCPCGYCAFGALHKLKRSLTCLSASELHDGMRLDPANGTIILAIKAGERIDFDRMVIAIV